MMGLVYPWICIQSGIRHNTVDEVIDDSSDAIDTTESFVKA